MFNGHSLVGELKRVLVCSPQAAGWADDRMNQWRELGFLRRPTAAIAQSQHEEFCRQLAASGAEVLHLPGSPELTLDAAYTHDASFSTDHGLIAMHPGKKNRVPEARRHQEFCGQSGVAMLGEITQPATMEGGDIVWLDVKTLLIGNGFRTNKQGIAQMRALLAPHGVEVLEAPLPYGLGPGACLHLMSLMSMLDDKTVLVDLPWMAVETVQLLRGRGLDLIEIDSSERDSLAVNVLSLGKKRLLAIEQNEKTNRKLRDAGFDVGIFAGDELCVNGGGGPTCLTRPLMRGE
ncbi:MAG TPA: arginine deiminase family protein [Terriglobales bacterium]|jgi:N-dimethylarginine dimethylaminohydrolase